MNNYHSHHNHDHMCVTREGSEVQVGVMIDPEKQLARLRQLTETWQGRGFPPGWSHARMEGHVDLSFDEEMLVLEVTQGIV